MDILSPDLLLNKGEFRRVLFRALLFPIVSALLLALLIAWQIRALLDMSDWVDRSQQVISQSHQIQKILIDMETGLRGFSLTRSKKQLRAFQRARAELAPALKNIASSLKDHPGDMTLITKLGAMAQEWNVRYADIQMDRLALGKRTSNAEMGQAIMAEMRTKLTRLADSATLLRESRVHRARTMARVLSGGGVLLAISIGFFLAMSARKHLLQLTDLYQKSLAERNRLLSRETHRSQQLQSLAQLAVALNTTVDMENRLHIVTDQARRILGANLAMITLRRTHRLDRPVHSVSSSEKYRSTQNPVAGSEYESISNLVCSHNQVHRLTGAEMLRHPAWENFFRKHPDLGPVNGWLAAPLIGQDGKNLGVIQLNDKMSGPFTTEDEFILVQVAQAAAVAVENSRLFEGEQEAVRTRDEFLSIASHELKTPLTSLRLQIQLLEKILGRQDPELRQKFANYFSHSIKSMDRITHLVDDMLDISRISAGRLNLQRERFDLAGLVREVLDRLGPIASQSSCDLRLEEAAPAWGEWDRFRLDQVITNLVTNAVKYGAGSPISVRVRQKNGSAQVEIKDQGIGIAQENHERIFQRFERVSSEKSVSGMGLGLYITRQIVDMHAGQLEVESSLGQGALFRLRLPTTADH